MQIAPARIDSHTAQLDGAAFVGGWKMDRKPVIGLVMGSDSDLKHLKDAIDLLAESGMPFEVRVMSAHRTPDAVAEYASGAAGAGIRVIVAAAGGAAHLAGAIAARTALPVVGVPVPSSDLNGLDSLLSTVQMPPGVPVAAMGIGSAGAVNAALFALEVLSLSDSDASLFVSEYRRKKQESVLEKDRAIRSKLSRG